MGAITRVAPLRLSTCKSTAAGCGAGDWLGFVGPTVGVAEAACADAAPEECPEDDDAQAGTMRMAPAIRAAAFRTGTPGSVQQAEDLLVPTFAALYCWRRAIRRLNLTTGW